MQKWMPRTISFSCAVLVVFVCSFFASGGTPYHQERRQEQERRRESPEPIQLAGGSLVEFESLLSETLGTTQPYSIFLPPSYQAGTRRYPVVYFLHGLNNNHTSWTVDRYGRLHEKTESLILAGELPEIIMVHPKGDNSFYCNYADGSKRYEDFVRQELVEHIESHYRVKEGGAHRSIAGTSMGGYGALKIAMKYPDQYSAVAGHSPIIFLGKNPLDVPAEVQSSRYFQFFVRILRPIFGVPFRQQLWDANNTLLLARSAKLGGLKIHFDYGTGDRYIQRIRLDKGVEALDHALTEANVDHSFKVYPGEAHGWALVSAHFKESLEFLCQNF